VTAPVATSDIPRHLARLRALAMPGFACELPVAWEVTAYRLPADPRADVKLDGGLKEGRLHVHQRENPVAQCTWRRYGKAPDVATTMIEVARKAPGGMAPDKPAPLPRPAAGDFLSMDHADGARQFARYFADQDPSGAGFLLHWFIPAGTPVPEAEATALLASHRANRGDTRQWSLFGITVTAPAAFAFARVDTRGAAVAFELVDRKGLHLRAWRMPLAEFTLAATDGPAGVLRQILHSHGARGIGAGNQTVRGRPGARAAFSRSAKSGIEGIFARWHPGEAWLWHDQDEGRIYALEQWGPKKHARLDPGCCA
jgi:hypothetical protein